MNRARFLENQIQSYAWGSRSAIARLMGEPFPSPGPQAELWMGAHPLAPSLVVTEDGVHPLDAWIGRDPQAVLGVGVEARFGATLPFLAKVLAAARPLSVQAHPDLAQAREGFERERSAGIPIDSPERSYRDGNHKPELMLALEPFHALSGFRPRSQALALARTLGSAALVEILEAGGAAGLAESEALAAVMQALLALSPRARARLSGQAAECASIRASADHAFGWIGRLAREYPGDPWIVAPVLLNLVLLAPGQALVIPAGRLHCYLEGVGIEVMASSDNVLRAGLTPKHVDAGELRRILVFEPSSARPVDPVPSGDGIDSWPCPFEEFALARISLVSGREFVSSAAHGVEILLCTRGKARLSSPGGPSLEISQGSSLLVPASAPAYTLAGDATLWRTSVPSFASP